MTGPADNELLSAYFDLEVSLEERAAIGKETRDSATAQKLLADWTAIRSELRDLPRPALPQDFAARVAAEVTRRQTLTRRRFPLGSKLRSFSREWVVALAGLAASIVGLLVCWPARDNHGGMPSEAVARNLHISDNVLLGDALQERHLARLDSLEMKQSLVAFDERGLEARGLEERLALQEGTLQESLADEKSTLGRGRFSMGKSLTSDLNGPIVTGSARMAPASAAKNGDSLDRTPREDALLAESRRKAEGAEFGALPTESSLTGLEEIESNIGLTVRSENLATVEPSADPALTMLSASGGAHGSGGGYGNGLDFNTDGVTIATESEIRQGVSVTDLVPYLNNDQQIPVFVLNVIDVATAANSTQLVLARTRYDQSTKSRAGRVVPVPPEDYSVVATSSPKKDESDELMAKKIEDSELRSGPASGSLAESDRGKVLFGTSPNGQAWSLDFDESRDLIVFYIESSPEEMHDVLASLQRQPWLRDLRLKPPVPTQIAWGEHAANLGVEAHDVYEFDRDKLKADNVKEPSESASSLPGTSAAAPDAPLKPSEPTLPARDTVAGLAENRLSQDVPAAHDSTMRADVKQREDSHSDPLVPSEIVPPQMVARVVQLSNSLESPPQVTPLFDFASSRLSEDEVARFSTLRRKGVDPGQGGGGALTPENMAAGETTAEGTLAAPATSAKPPSAGVSPEKRGSPVFSPILDNSMMHEQYSAQQPQNEVDSRYYNFSRSLGNSLSVELQEQQLPELLVRESSAEVAYRPQIFAVNLRHVDSANGRYRELDARDDRDFYRYYRGTVGQRPSIRSAGEAAPMRLFLFVQSVSSESRQPASNVVPFIGGSSAQPVASPAAPETAPPSDNP